MLWRSIGNLCRQYCPEFVSSTRPREKLHHWLGTCLRQIRTILAHRLLVVPLCFVFFFLLLVEFCTISGFVALGQAVARNASRPYLQFSCSQFPLLGPTCSWMLRLLIGLFDFFCPDWLCKLLWFWCGHAQEIINLGEVYIFRLKNFYLGISLSNLEFRLKDKEASSFIYAFISTLLIHCFTL